MDDFAFKVTESWLPNKIFDSHFIVPFVLLGSTDTDDAYVCSLNDSQICLGFVFKYAVYLFWESYISTTIAVFITVNQKVDRKLIKTSFIKLEKRIRNMRWLQRTVEN